MKLPLCLALLALSLSEIAHAAPTSAGVPLPRPRPAAADEVVSLVDRILNDPDFLRIPDPDPPGIASPCQIRMTERIIAVFQSVPAITRARPRLRGERCGAARNHPASRQQPRDDVAARHHALHDGGGGGALGARRRHAGFRQSRPGACARIDNYASYDCRGRNNVANARTSEHGYANALDIRGVRLADGKFVQWTDRTVAKDVREGLRKDACARFTTVLGPGSDGHHEEHIHVDLAERRGGYRLCQWNVLDPVPDVPLPRPRPADAPQAVALPGQAAERVEKKTAPESAPLANS